ncbi:unnamed protein product [Pleuronectes platessa]|uniref:Uncharacterized protein n=1 Tax=Pleuronectes platessa TaxID=8262 RepID=A0A9N7YH80_PLEPL|nr:unnamed protein product [Pleuronectes platessa]
MEAALLSASSPWHLCPTPHRLPPAHLSTPAPLHRGRSRRADESSQPPKGRQKTARWGTNQKHELRDPMGSGQMARPNRPQMPTSYLSRLCQDKTHEAGIKQSRTKSREER